MGLLRFLLALAVLVDHSQPYHGIGFTGGRLAVEAFFMISGFYMTMILNEKYIGEKSSYWLFIKGRLMRLFPMYWLVLTITLVCALWIPHYNDATSVNNLNSYYSYAGNLNVFSWVFMAFTNLFILFQDLVMFLSLDAESGALFFSTDAAHARPEVFKFRLVVQAWSISLELFFYLLAPFLVRRKPVIILTILLVSLGLKVFGYSQGLKEIPWTYFFFPFELGYFLLGSICYFIYSRYVKNAASIKTISIVLMTAVALFTALFNQVDFKGGGVAYLTLVFISIPFIFNYTKRIKLDREIGELSYPMYLSHILIFNLLATLDINWHRDLLKFLVTIAFSLLLNKLFGEPLERFRQRRLAV